MNSIYQIIIFILWKFSDRMIRIGTYNYRMGFINLPNFLYQFTLEFMPMLPPSIPVRFILKLIYYP